MHRAGTPPKGNHPSRTDLLKHICETHARYSYVAKSEACRADANTGTVKMAVGTATSPDLLKHTHSCVASEAHLR